MDKKNKSCLVTGASGFIGRELCRKLQQEGYVVRALLRSPAVGPWDEYVIQDLSLLKECLLPDEIVLNIDIVFHVAGVAHANEGSVSKEDYWNINVEGTRDLIHLASTSEVSQFIYFSSVKAIDALDEYGLSKRAAEDIVLKSGKENSLRVCVLQPALVYGIPLKGNLLSMLRAVESGWFPPIPENRNERSLISLNDLTRVALLILEHPQTNGKIYPVTDGQAYSTRQLYEYMRLSLGLKPIRWYVPEWGLRLLAKLADVLQYLVGKKLPFNSNVVEKLLGSSYYSSEGLQQDLPWKPQDSFLDKLPMIVEAYQKSHKKVFES